MEEKRPKKSRIRTGRRERVGWFLDWFLNVLVNN